MKMLVSKEWCMRAAEREGDFSVGACSPEIAARAGVLAKAAGHDADAEITCEGGAKIPAWQLYLTQAALELHGPQSPAPTP